MNARAASLLLALLALITACRGGRSFALRDTEGWEYSANCPANGCGRALESPHPTQASLRCEAGEHAGFALAGRGVIAACHACMRGDVPRVVDPADCRALVCERDPDCPPAIDGVHTTCVRGLCQAAGAALDEVAVVSLCMAGSGGAGHEGAGERSARVAIAHASCPNASVCRASPACRGR